MSVLVTDARGNHALAVIRSLGRRGVRVIASDCTRLAAGGYSRYCAKRVTYPSPSAEPDRFRDSLLRLIDRLRPEVLMPMTERTIQALLPVREAIESRLTLAPLPSAAALGVAFDKQATIDLAASLAVRAPRTLAIRGPEELPGIRGRVTFPAVIKPRRSEFETADGRIVAGGPVEYCFKPADLEAAYLAVHRRAPCPLIQEFVPGDGYGVSVLYDRGRLRALFAHRRVRMLRPTGSGSTLRESIAPPPDMVAAARSLLEALEWHGVAMVEFKRDARDGSSCLMEINGRFWNSLPLAIASGVDFPYLLHALATQGRCPGRFDYRTGVQGRWLAGDARHLLAVLRGRPAGWPDRYPSRWRTLVEFMRVGGRQMHYDDLWLSDPAPFVAGVATALVGRFPGLIRPRHRPVKAARDARAAS